MKPEDLAARLTAFLAAATSDPSVRVQGLRRLAGGASRETWSFELGSVNGPARRLVLRLDPGATSVDSDRALEFRVLGAVRRAGVPVPEVLWLGDDPELLSGRFFVMEHVEGETLARRLLRDPEYADARPRMAGQLGAILARIHAVPTGDADLHGVPVPAAGTSGADAELDRYETLFRGVAPEPHPAIEIGLRWLRARVPRAAARVLVHGDFRIGNVIFGPDGVRAVLDWELVHWGDPMEDLGWMCVKAWRFGGALPVGGVGRREDFFAAYEAAGGVRVDPEVVRFWEVFGNLKWAIICVGQARTHLSGAVPSVELASLGRRTAEVEADLLAVID